MMNEREIIEKWISVFGRDIDEKIIEEHVTSLCNHMWHIFSWGDVADFEGDDARRAFDALDYEKAIRFHGGYSCEIEDVSVTEKLTAKELDDDPESDIYIVAEDFSWTYVRTHEKGLCGPYFRAVK